MPGLDDVFLAAVKRKTAAPSYTMRDLIMGQLPLYGIPESEPQFDPGNPLANKLYDDYINRTGRTPWHASPYYSNSAEPAWRQVAPRQGDVSNMPVVNPKIGGSDPGLYSYDELGRKYPGMTIDDLMSSPHSNAMTDAIYRMMGISPDLPGLQMLDAMRGGG